MNEAAVREEVVERLAVRVAELLEPKLIAALEARTSTTVTPSLVDAATVARTLGVERSWVYANADKLGGVRLGEGDRPRLRFDLEKARECMGAKKRTPPKRSNGSRSTRRSTAPLLPIRGTR